MEVNVSYETQHLWTSWFAVYLYLGGLGAATVAVTFLTDMYIKPHKPLVIWGALSGLIMVGGGSGMLFLHLANHIAVIHVLNPMVIFNKPDAWIAWGTQFISWMLFAGVLYALPYMIGSPYFSRMPLIGSILKMGIVRSIGGMVGGALHRPLGLLAAISGIGVAVYTGLVLQSFPAVGLWNNPGVPILFTVSAFSTACAFLMLVLHVFMRRDEDAPLRKLYEHIDLGLVASELLIVFLFYMYLSRGSMSARASSDLLFGSPGWLFGFIGLGLIVPLLIELKGVTSHSTSRFPVVTASILVLVGGFLLRNYFMAAGVYAIPT